MKSYWLLLTFHGLIFASSYTISLNNMKSTQSFYEYEYSCSNQLPTNSCYELCIYNFDEGHIQMGKIHLKHENFPKIDGEFSKNISEFNEYYLPLCEHDVAVLSESGKIQAFHLPEFFYQKEVTRIISIKTPNGIYALLHGIHGNIVKFIHIETARTTPIKKYLKHNPVRQAHAHNEHRLNNSLRFSDVEGTTAEETQEINGALEAIYQTELDQLSQEAADHEKQMCFDICKGLLHTAFLGVAIVQDNLPLVAIETYNAKEAFVSAYEEFISSTVCAQQVQACIEQYILSLENLTQNEANASILITDNTQEPVSN